MVDTLGGLGNQLSGLGNNALDMILIFFVFLMIGGAIFFVIWRFRNWKKYQQYVILYFFKNPVGKLEYGLDQAGVFIDKRTNAKRLYIKKAGASLSCDSVPFYRIGKTKIILMYKLSSKNFRFLNPIAPGDNISFSVSEDDVNNAILEMNKWRTRLEFQGWKEWVHIILIMVVCLLVVVVMLALIRKLDTLTMFSQNFKEAAQYNLEATRNLMALKNGTAVIMT